MLNRRQLLQRPSPADYSVQNWSYAKRPMGGVLLEQKDFRFHNATRIGRQRNRVQELGW